ncbi:DJ-1/PfpI family protein [Aspergillus clavatus NRRL 1]|uniref:DJ-1/PfpI family protein n=1 Tax=Aspergillus clavatus (strain ATCC 1007 / CBS 513.65 / DSM 816 / NCTC 3887 / NRRL 1 / QM 1276 / 107) TaxID=344612 RepID=A1C8N5_ASPCL|nr:DJ-1/PfpI family protein [Aspergillus clavatus NRRL 1]EAW13672.1 DJ-1/PfpI family protein [Aspergillus clavatus NRRL 1]
MHYAMLLFPGFEALDVFGPLEVLNVLSERTKLHLSLLSTTLDPVSTKSPDPAAHRIGSVCAQEVVPTNTLTDILTAVHAGQTSIDVLLVPGGAGTRFPEIINPVIEFVRGISPSVAHVISICNGAGVVARAGVLDGKRATTNKMLWTKTTALRSEVEWVKEARWVRDGEVWTSSGVSAGIDVALAFVREVYGRNVAGGIAREIEYVWDEEDDGTRDLFASHAV